MAFSERQGLKDERRPLLRDPVWHYNHRYGNSRSQDPEAVDELLGLDGSRNQRFQWLIFLSVTFISILILLATLGVLIKLSQTHTLPGSKVPTTPAFPSMIPPSTPVETTSSTIATTIAPLIDPFNVSSAAPPVAPS